MTLLANPIWIICQWKSSLMPNTLSPVGDYTMLAASALCNFVRFMSYKMPSRGPIAMASPLEAFTRHSFRLNCTFKPFYIRLLIEKKMACNLGTWSAYLIWIWSISPLTIVFTMALTTLSSPKCTLHGTITLYIYIYIYIYIYQMRPSAKSCVW
jgi:hypothetical protein